MEDGALLRHITWHRVAFFESRMIVAHFAWVVPVRVLDDPDIRALTTIVEREALNAVIVDRDAFELKSDPAGRA